jgi:hypothetical protein
MNYEGIYYLEIGLNREVVHGRSLVWGLKILEEMREGAWGYLIFQDILEERQRIIILKKEPMTAATVLIECISDIGEMFRFLYLDQKVWSQTAHSFFPIPEKDARALTTTKAIQNYFKGRPLTA